MRDHVNVARRIDAGIPRFLRIVEIEKVGQHSRAFRKHGIAWLDFDWTLGIETDQAMLRLPWVLDRKATVDAVAFRLVGVCEE